MIIFIEKILHKIVQYAIPWKQNTVGFLLFKISLTNNNRQIKNFNLLPINLTKVKFVEIILIFCLN